MRSRRSHAILVALEKESIVKVEILEDIRGPSGLDALAHTK